MTLDPVSFWSLTAALGIGTFLIRFSFLGFLGRRQLPDWAMRHLKYVCVAVLPAMVTPLVLWPSASVGEVDPVRLIAAAAAFIVGLRFSVIGAIGAGMGTLWLLQAVT